MEFESLVPAAMARNAGWLAVKKPDFATECLLFRLCARISGWRRMHLGFLQIVRRGLEDGVRG